jgi:hypothetical protein
VKAVVADHAAFVGAAASYAAVVAAAALAAAAAAAVVVAQMSLAPASPFTSIGSDFLCCCTHNLGFLVLTQY